MNRVDEKVAVVTGGTQGLGKAIAMNLAKMGAKGVIALGRNKQRGEEVVNSIKFFSSCAMFSLAKVANILISPFFQSG